MRHGLGFAFILCTASLVATSTTAATNTNEEVIDHGRYVSIAADCQSCHTSVADKPFAGGVSLKTGFGPLVTPNITPEKETGIGTWTRDNFDSALRHGTDDEGKPLYPAMPYTSYTLMTDADLDALWAYMQTVKPVKNKVEVNQLRFPYDVRASMFVWQALFFKEGRFQPDPSRESEYNRGDYLVNALEHCGSCHTPRNALGAGIAAKALQGATIEEWYAPDISNGKNSVIQSWSEQRLTSFLREHNGKNLTPPFGPMAEVVYNSTDQLKSDDIAAIAHYLKNQPQASEKPVAADDDVPFKRKEMGRAIYDNQCAKCHGPDGKGKAGVAADLAGNEALLARKPYNMLSVLMEGIEPRGIWGEMPSFAQALSDQEIADVANYVRTAWDNAGFANVTANEVEAWRTFASMPSEELEKAMVCPNVPADWLDDEVRAALKTIGMGDIDESKVQSIYDSYSGRFPHLTAEDRAIAFVATYCRDAAQALPNKTAVIKQVLEFTNALNASNAIAQN